MHGYLTHTLLFLGRIVCTHRNICMLYYLVCTIYIVMPKDFLIQSEKILNDDLFLNRNVAN